MTIPDTLSARKAELEREITASETEAMLFTRQADQQRAELRGIDMAIKAYEAALPDQLADQPTPAKRERRDLRGMVLEYIEAEETVSSKAICGQFYLTPAYAKTILAALRAHGKITGDDTGWRVVREQPLSLAAE